MNVQEQIERIEATSSTSVHKRSAVFSAILAVALALFEFGDHAAQHRADDFNTKASDVWAFMKAKTLRQTVLRSFAEAVEVIVPPETRTEAAKQQIDGWRKTVARYESDPAERVGRKELQELAKRYEHDRDIASVTQRIFKFASSLAQVAIIIVSASVLLHVIWLMWLGVGLGIVGLALGLLGWTSPAWILHFHLN
jgi:hypothetical protein